METPLHLLQWLVVITCLWIIPAIFIQRFLECRIGIVRLACVWVPLVMPVTAFIWTGLRVLGLSAIWAFVFIPVVAVSLNVFKTKAVTVHAKPSKDFYVALVFALLLALAAALTYGTTVRWGQPVTVRGYHEFAATDQANYASVVAESVHRPVPGNPFIAGNPMPATYTGFAPAVALDAVFGVPAIEAWSVFLMPTALFFVALAAWFFGRSLKLTPTASIIAAVLVSLAGDLPIIFRLIGEYGPKWYIASHGDTSYFLLFNTWTIVLPTAFAAPTLAIENKSVPFKTVLGSFAISLASITKPFLMPAVPALLIAAQPRYWKRITMAVILGLVIGLYASGVIHANNPTLGMTFLPGRFLSFMGERIGAYTVGITAPLERKSSTEVYFALVGISVAAPIALGVRLFGFWHLKRLPKERFRPLFWASVTGFLPLLLLWLKASPYDFYQFAFFPLYLLWLPVAGYLTDRRHLRSFMFYPIALITCLQLLAGLLAFRTTEWISISPRAVDRYLQLSRRAAPDAIVIAKEPDLQFASPINFLAERGTLLGNLFHAQRYSDENEIKWRKEILKLDYDALKKVVWPQEWNEIWLVSHEGESIVLKAIDVKGTKQ